MVTRRATPARGDAPGPADAPLTEAQVSGGSPVARLVHAHPWIMDVTVAVVIVLVALVGVIFAWQAAVGARFLGLYPMDSEVERTVATTWLVGAFGAAALLLFRRARPLTVTALLTAGFVASVVAGGVQGVLGAAVACALYSVAEAHGPRVTWSVVAAVLVVLTAATWWWEQLGFVEMTLWYSAVPSIPEPWESAQSLPEPPFAAARRTGSLLVLHAVLLLGVAVGSAARARRLHAQDLVERYRALARERDQSAALARAAERAHIAREMHDVVAHNVSVMVTLADGADAAFERAPDLSRDAVRQIARTGRAALGDMQGVLGALGPASADDGRHAEPTEVDLPTLVERFEAAGLPVRATGLDTELPDDTSVRLAVLRILGEALTNVLRHAAGTPSVEVTVRRTPTAVEIDVLDGGGTRPGTGSGTRRGIVGMGERAAILGGHVSAGPRPEGGWRVHAVLPCSGDEEGAR